MVYYHLYRARQTVALRYRKVVATARPYLAERIEYLPDAGASSI